MARGFGEVGNVNNVKKSRENATLGDSGGNMEVCGVSIVNFDSKSAVEKVVKYVFAQMDVKVKCK